jgi:hypothetical protein
MFMSEGVRQEEQCEQKAIECERIAAKLPPEDHPFRRMYVDLAAKWREKASFIAADRRRRDERSASM